MFLLTLLACFAEPTEIAHNWYSADPVTDRELHDFSASVVDQDDITIHLYSVRISSLRPEIATVNAQGQFRCEASGEALFEFKGGGLTRQHVVTCALD